MPSVILPSTRIAKEFAHLHERLRRVFNFMLESAWPEAQNVFITSIYRNKQEDEALDGSGVHHTLPHRAIDIRTHTLTDGERATVTRRLNDRFSYDPQRPKLPVAYSAIHGTGPHLHLQTSEYTVEHDGPPKD